jgi:hypothetical protein
MGIVYFSNTWEKYSSFSLQKDWQSIRFSRDRPYKIRKKPKKNQNVWIQVLRKGNGILAPLVSPYLVLLTDPTIMW